MLPFSDDELSSQMAVLASNQKERNSDLDAMLDFAVEVYAKKRRFKTGELVNSPKDAPESLAKETESSDESPKTQ